MIVMSDESSSNNYDSAEDEAYRIDREALEEDDDENVEGIARKGRGKEELDGN